MWFIFDYSGFILPQLILDFLCLLWNLSHEPTYDRPDYYVSEGLIVSFSRNVCSTYQGRLFMIRIFSTECSLVRKQ
jgi:hypothetical protein